MIHDSCGNKMEKMENMFYWRGDWRPGWVCVTCKALFPVAHEEIEPLRTLHPEESPFERNPNFAGSIGQRT